MAAGGQRIVLWFRNDLRLHDNQIVHEAAQKIASKQYKEVRRRPYTLCLTSAQPTQPCR
jgi:deoxyribodipyrimidine photolyase